MSIKVRKIADNSLFSFTCAQWAMMEAANKADWEVIENLCGRVTLINNPYAASEFFYTLDGQVAADTPLQISTVDGISTIRFQDQAAATVLAGPVSGPDAYPTFRALQLTDLPDLTETIQDAIGPILTDTDTVNFTYTDATPEIKADVRLQMSITSDASGIKLSGDAASPGNNKVYGTDGTGVKGWKDDPAGIADGDKGDITVSAGGTTWTIDNNTISDAKLRDSAATSVIGRSLGTAGDPGDIIAASDGQVLRRAGGVLGFGQIDTDGIADGAVSLAKIQNIGTDRLLGRDAAGTGMAEEISLNATLEFTGTGSIQRAALTGDVTATAGSNATTIANGAVTTAKIANNAVDNTKIRQGVARSVIGVTGNATANVADIQGTADQVLRVNTAGTALEFGTVATNGIANDAVTYAKIQNVSATNRVLGRIAAGAGDVQELTNTDLYTIMGLTGTANRFALWTGPNTLSSDAAFTFDAVNDRMTITGTVAGLGANNAFLNLNSGAIAGATEFLRLSGNITANLLAGQYNAHNANAAAHSIYTISSGGANGGDPVLQFSVNAVVTHCIGIDNSDADKLKITPNSATPGGVLNSGIIITNAQAARVGINKDAPQHPLDVEGIAQAHQFRNHTNAWTAGNIAFGTGAGTGPAVNDIVGGVNGFRIRFTTGTTPTNNGDIFTATYPTSFGGESYVTMSGRTTVAYNDERAKFYVSAAGANSFTLKANGTLTASKEYHIQFTIFGITLG